jgi:hypothetical protein
MEPLTFRHRVRAVTLALDGCGIPYALGGAIAFGYCAEPRATIEIDVNVFAADTSPGAVLDCLKPLGITFDSDQATKEIGQTGQIRLIWDSTPLDLFFSYVAFHDSVQSRARRVPFDDVVVNIVSAEDLVVFTAMFDRPKDWLDIDQILAAQGSRFDWSCCLRWLDEIVGREHASRTRLAAMRPPPG